MPNTSDCLIIGGGVIGCALAYYLSKHHLTVTVLERGSIGGQASGSAAGLIAPLGPLSSPGPLADFVLAGFAQFPSVVAELEEGTNLQLRYEQTGALRTVWKPKRVAHLHKRYQHWQPLGLHMQWFTGEEARQQEPSLAPEVCAAVFSPEGGCASIDTGLCQGLTLTWRSDFARSRSDQFHYQEGTSQRGQDQTGSRL